MSRYVSAQQATILPRLVEGRFPPPPRGHFHPDLIRRLQQRTMGAHLANWIGHWPSIQAAWEALTIPCDLVHWVRYTHELHNERTPLGSASHRLLTRLCVAGVRTKIHLAYNPAPFVEKLDQVDAWALGADLDPKQIEREIFELVNLPHPDHGKPYTLRRTQGEIVTNAVVHAAACAKGCYGGAEMALLQVDGMHPHPEMIAMLRAMAPVPPPFFLDP